MAVTVCLAARTIGYPDGGGHFWVYLNWALGLAANGCRVVWLETLRVDDSRQARHRIAQLRRRLEPFGLADDLAVAAHGRASNEIGSEFDFYERDTSEIDLLVNLNANTHRTIVERFGRSVFIDIDPGLLQTWIDQGAFELPSHDVYVTTGETVGTPRAQFPDAGLDWQHLPPCVSLEDWPVVDASAAAPFTTVSHWQMGEWMLDGDEVYCNDKRAGFLPFVGLPRRTSARLELALSLDSSDNGDAAMLREAGWRVRRASSVAGTPEAYRAYIQRSRGEFSCVKPSCVRLQNAWISDRTLCYLASGKPAIVQHTGPSAFLPEAEGIFRFHTLDEAAWALEQVAADYEHHSRSARALAERHFDAKKVTGRLLETVLP